ncbi:MAG TPA: haloacid dehalogenase-like hydrolase, partial [Candidatus Angelobacter sp.]|nr:haloacid dehalogenase-like hydrolase [Candidatus Angelobacter sp.]
GLATDRLIRVPTDEGKARAIREVIARPVDVCCGNSIHDAAMLALAGHPVAVNPNPGLEPIARERGWRIYRPV